MGWGSRFRKKVKKTFRRVEKQVRRSSDTARKQVERTAKSGAKNYQRAASRAGKEYTRYEEDIRDIAVDTSGRWVDKALGTDHFFTDAAKAATGVLNLSAMKESAAKVKEFVEGMTPDMPDFNDDVSAFLGSSYKEEEDEDEIEYGGSVENVAGTTESTVRKAAPRKTSTGLRVSKGGINL